MSIGEVLAQARHQAGLTVAQVSQRTRIRQTIIRGIEDDDYRGCGGDFYARGHIRSIAKVAGIDSVPLIEEFDRIHRVPGAMSAATVGELTEQSRKARRRRNAPMLLGLALVLILGVAGYLLGPGGGPGKKPPAVAGHQLATHRPAARGGPSPAVNASATAGHPSPSASPSAPASAPAVAAPRPRPLKPASVTAFGPYGEGQGDNPELASMATDGSTATAWHTDWYTTAQFGNLYPGTGLLFDMGRPVTVTGARIVLGSAPGASFQVRVGNSPTRGGLVTAASADGAHGTVQPRLAAPAHGRYVLIWFTRLPPDPAGTYQAHVYDIKIEGMR